MYVALATPAPLTRVCVRVCVFMCSHCLAWLCFDIREPRMTIFGGDWITVFPNLHAV